MASEKKTTVGTPFVWASAVSGKKKTIVEMNTQNAAAAAAQAAAQAVAAAAAAQAQFAAAQAAAARSAIAIEEAGLLKAAREMKTLQYEKEKAARDEKYSAANGYWVSSCEYHNPNTEDYYDVKPEINAHALEYVQAWLFNRGAMIITTRSVDALQDLFERDYAARVKMYYGDEREFSCGWSVFKWWQDFKLKQEVIPTAREFYQRLQEWVVYELAAYHEKVKAEKEWNSFRKIETKPPWIYTLYIFCQNVTWKNVLAVLVNAFPTPYLEIMPSIVSSSPTGAGAGAGGAASIVWHVKVDPYLAFNFHKKPACQQKLIRKAIEEKEEKENAVDDWYAS